MCASGTSRPPPKLSGELSSVCTHGAPCTYGAWELSSPDSFGSGGREVPLAHIISQAAQHQSVLIFFFFFYATIEISINWWKERGYMNLLHRARIKDLEGQGHFQKGHFRLRRALWLSKKAPRPSKKRHKGQKKERKKKRAANSKEGGGGGGTPTHFFSPTSKTRAPGGLTLT